MNISFQATVVRTRGAASTPLPVNVTSDRAGTVQILNGTTPAGFTIGVAAATPILAGQTLAIAINFACTADPGKMDSPASLIVRFVPTGGNAEDTPVSFFMRDRTYETTPAAPGTYAIRCLFDRWVPVGTVPLGDVANAAYRVSSPVNLTMTFAPGVPALDASFVTLRPEDGIYTPPDGIDAAYTLWARGSNLWPGNGLPPAEGVFEQYPAILYAMGQNI